MDNPLYLAQITYRNRQLDSLDQSIIGMFSTSEKAREAIENVSEGTLSVSFNAEVLSSSIDVFELDKSIEDPDEIAAEAIPF